LFCCKLTTVKWLYTGKLGTMHKNIYSPESTVRSTTYSSIFKHFGIGNNYAIKVNKITGTYSMSALL